MSPRAVLAAVGFALNLRASTATGLHRTVYAAGDLLNAPLLEDVVDHLVLGLGADTPDRAGTVRVVWRGLWYVPAKRAIGLSAGGSGRLAVWVDGTRLLFRQPAGLTGRTARVVTLSRGLHSLTVDYEGPVGIPGADLHGTGLVAHRFFQHHAAPADVWFASAGAWTGAGAAVMWLTTVVIAVPLAAVVCVLVVGRFTFPVGVNGAGRGRHLVMVAWSTLEYLWKRERRSLRVRGNRLRATLCINKAHIERMLHATLPVACVAFFAGGVIEAVRNYRMHAGFVIGDWLINYQGGFVRRGLLGEAMYGLYRITAIDPGTWVLLLQIVLYAAFLGSSYALLRRGRLLPYALLIFTPFVLTYYDGLGVGWRKEQVFLTLLAFSVWALRCTERRSGGLVFIAVLCSYPLVVLSHEMLFAFVPYLLAAYVVSGRRPPLQQSAWILGLTCLSAASFSMVLLYGRPVFGVTELILESLREANYAIAGGAVAALNTSVTRAHGFVVEMFALGNYPKYVVVILLVVLGFLPAYKRLGCLVRNRVCLSLMCAGWVLTLPLFLVAVDWGRFIRIHAVALFLLSLGTDAERVGRHEHAGGDGDGASIGAVRGVLWMVGFFAYIAFWENSALRPWVRLRKRASLPDGSVSVD